ncbi:MAG: response regulator [Chloroflexi bacterium]|nr:response regulator [Chloroflexota bacterium]
MARKILLADDEETVRSLVAATIRDDSQYVLFEARNGIEALDIARREKPDLLLLDIVMPGLSGFEVCRRLKSDPETSGISIVILTALAQEADREKGRSVGADDYFSKPFSPTALIQMVEQMLGL